MAITNQTLRLIYALRESLTQITDARTRALTAAWIRAWDLAVPELGMALFALATVRDDGRWPTRAQIARADRAQRALSTVEGHLVALSRAAMSGIVSDATAAFTLTGRAQGGLISTQLPAGSLLTVHADATWSRVDPAAIDAIIKRSTEQITALSLQLSSEAMNRIRAELVRGVLVGANPAEAARRMLHRLEGEFNGGLNRALTIARTEMLDAHRAGAMLAQSASADVLNGWIWNAQLGRRTCPACFSMHGTEHPLSQPGPHGHQRCRCSRTPLVKTWRELGINLPEPPSVLPDAEKTFRAMPRVDQLHVMGPTRLAAYDRGDIAWRDLAVRRDNPAWRPSYVSTPVRDLVGS